MFFLVLRFRFTLFGLAFVIFLSFVLSGSESDKIYTLFISFFLSRFVCIFISVQMCKLFRSLISDHNMFGFHFYLHTVFIRVECGYGNKYIKCWPIVIEGNKPSRDILSFVSTKLCVIFFSFSYSNLFLFFSFIPIKKYVFILFLFTCVNIRICYSFKLVLFSIAF